jgi:patatin-like phospholipase/acyl hydrolase
MVFGQSYGQSYGDGESAVMWDFRQFYIEWTKIYMLNFSQADFSDNYPKMLDALHKWHGVIWGRRIKDFNVEDHADKTFEKLIENIIKLANKDKYQNTYFLKDRNPNAVSDLNKAFKSAKVYLVWLMKKTKLFGTETVNRGL